MSREMAAPSARTRLTVQVLPLEAGNAHGPHRAQAVAAFKGRKFALPVQWEDTFEDVWRQIEKRYLTNYLDAQQAATFTIKKLQDAYDCDLDLGDTVSSIFEGETDPAMRTIKVVPTFVNRNFSVPVTSHLRPGFAQKRHRETNAEHGNKRRRVEQQQPLDDIQEEVDPSRDQPIPTTESERSGDDNAGKSATHGTRPSSHSPRSRTGGSMVIVNGAPTGHAEFGPDIKEESPELGLPLVRKAPTTPSIENAFKKPSVPVSQRSPRRRQSTMSPSKTRRVPPQPVYEPHVADEVPASSAATVQDAHIQEEIAQHMQDNSALSGLDSQKAALHQSPRPTSEPSYKTPPPAAAKRRDIYDVPSSPEFLYSRSKSKSKKTYGKSPRAARTIRGEAALLNDSRPLSNHARTRSSTQRSITDSISKKAQPRLDRSTWRKGSSPIVVTGQNSGQDATQSSTGSKSAKGRPAARITPRSASTRTSAVSPAKAMLTASRGGRPRKDARPRRGRPPKNDGNTSQQTPTPTPVVDSQSEIAKPAAPASPTYATGADEAVVISSREPSSTDYSDSEEEQQKTAPHAVNEKAGQALPLQKEEVCKTSSAENGAELVPETYPVAHTRALPKTPDAVVEGQEQDADEGTLVDTDTAQLQLEHPPSSEDKLLEKAEPIRWNTESWGFGVLDQPTSAPLPSQAMTNGTMGYEAEVDLAPRAESNSRSASAAISTKSSPAVTRQPARFLSHSPTPEASDGEDESEETSAPASKGPTPQPSEGKDVISESESSSVTEESETENEDTEMPDIPAEPLPESTANLNEDTIPSSPPRVHHLPNSTPLVPETSQPTSSQIKPFAIRRTPVPLPPPSQLRSSQSVSAHAAARQPAVHYSQFKTLKEQLESTKTKPASTQTKKYDPRTLNLGKLAAKAKGASNKIRGIGTADGSSSDESSSSSSSDSD